MEPPNNKQLRKLPSLQELIDRKELLDSTIVHNLPEAPFTVPDRLPVSFGQITSQLIGRAINPSLEIRQAVLSPYAPPKPPFTEVPKGISTRLGQSASELTESVIKPELEIRQHVLSVPALDPSSPRTATPKVRRRRPGINDRWTRWTDEEKKLLLDSIGIATWNQGKLQWSSISAHLEKVLPKRNEEACKHQIKKIPTMGKAFGAWTGEEDDILLQLYRDNDHEKEQLWKEASDAIPGRSIGACQSRGHYLTVILKR